MAAAKGREAAVRSAPSPASMGVTGADLDSGEEIRVVAKFQKMRGQEELKVADLEDEWWSIYWRRPGSTYRIEDKVQGRPQAFELKEQYGDGDFRLVPHHPETDAELSHLQVTIGVGAPHAYTETPMVTPLRSAPSFDNLPDASYPPPEPEFTDPGFSNDPHMTALMLAQHATAAKAAELREAREWSESQRQKQLDAERRDKQDVLDREERDRRAKAEKEEKEEKTRKEDEARAQAREDAKEKRESNAQMITLGLSALTTFAGILTPVVAAMAAPKPDPLSATLLPMLLKQNERPASALEDQLRVSNHIQQQVAAQTEMNLKLAALTARDRDDDDDGPSFMQQLGQFMPLLARPAASAPAPSAALPAPPPQAPASDFGAQIAGVLSNPEMVAEIIRHDPTAFARGVTQALQANPAMEQVFTSVWNGATAIPEPSVSEPAAPEPAA